MLVERARRENSRFLFDSQLTQTGGQGGGQSYYENDGHCGGEGRRDKNFFQFEDDIKRESKKVAPKVMKASPSGKP